MVDAQEVALLVLVVMVAVVVVVDHLYFLQSDSYDPERATLSLPPEHQSNGKLAIQLKRVIDGKGFYVDLLQCSIDPRKLDNVQSGKKTIWMNIGCNQFHLPEGKP